MKYIVIGYNHPQNEEADYIEDKDVVVPNEVDEVVRLRIDESADIADVMRCKTVKSTQLYQVCRSYRNRFPGSKSIFMGRLLAEDDMGCLHLAVLW